MSEGWVKLYRKIQQHWLYKQNRRFSKYEAWLDLVMDANHNDGQAAIGNTVTPVARGSILTSIEKLAAHWGWSRHKTDNFLNCLKRDRMIDYKKDSHFTIITIVNYDAYQATTNRKGHKKDSQKDINGTPTGHKQERNKNDRNKKEYSLESVEFQLSQLLLDLILERKPNFRKPDLQGWAVHIDRLIHLDKRSPEQLEAVIHWCQQDDFWQNNILSTEKLCKQIDKLELAMEKTSEQVYVKPLQYDSGGLTPRERLRIKLEKEK